MNCETPVIDHDDLPEGVPLVASFDDDRNRLSYYFPILERITGVRVPTTAFFPVSGSVETYLDIEYRDITAFMQSNGMQNTFVRGDYSSGKFDRDAGSKIESQDPYDIEKTVLELIRQLYLSKRSVGGRLAVREWIPHDREVRYFIGDGEVKYGYSIDDGNEFPDHQARCVASKFDTFYWSVDFIRHETSGSWYCIDMGLDGLYYTGDEWIAISEHESKSKSPECFSDIMPRPKDL